MRVETVLLVSTLCVLMSAIILWDGMEEEGGMHLAYHLFWPAVTETIWSGSQNPIQERERIAEAQSDWNKAGEGGLCYLRA